MKLSGNDKNNEVNLVHFFIYALKAGTKTEVLSGWFWRARYGGTGASADNHFFCRAICPDCAATISDCQSIAPAAIPWLHYSLQEG